MKVLELEQGTTRVIAVEDIVDAAGDPLDLTGWSVRAVARADGVRGPQVAAWSTTPGDGEGTATVTGSTVELQITPAMSMAWTFAVALLHVEIEAPDGRQERIAEAEIVLDRTTIY